MTFCQFDTHAYRYTHNFFLLSIMSCTFQYSGSKPRNQWEMWHPTLVAEAVFAIANIFSSLRLISLFTANSHLGPLQISLGRMLLDILKFLFIYCLVNMEQQNKENTLNEFKTFICLLGATLLFNLSRSYWHLPTASTSCTFTMRPRRRKESARASVAWSKTTLFLREFTLVQPPPPIS